MIKFFSYTLLVLIAYFAFRFFFLGQPIALPITDSDKRPAATVKAVIPNKEIIVELHNSQAESRITEITLSRSLASHLGLSPPTGFKEELLPLTEEARKDRETVEYIDNYNKETLRWVGSLQLAPKAIKALTFPAISTGELSGLIKFQTEAKWGIGGSVSFFHVVLGKTGTQPALPADAPKAQSETAATQR